MKTDYIRLVTPTNGRIVELELSNDDKNVKMLIEAYLDAIAKLNSNTTYRWNGNIIRIDCCDFKTAEAIRESFK